MSYYKSKKGYYYKQTGGGSVRVSETTYRSKSMKGGDKACNSERNISDKIPYAAVDVRNAIKDICSEINKINKLLKSNTQVSDSNNTTIPTKPKRYSFFSLKSKSSLSTSQKAQYTETLRILNIAYYTLLQQQELLQKERKDILNKQTQQKILTNAVTADRAKQQSQQQQLQQQQPQQQQLQQQQPQQQQRLKQQRWY